MDWRPIKTALMDNDEDFVILWFNPDREEPIVRSGFWSTEYRDWFESEASNHSLSEYYGQPTHWAPLEPPK